MKEILLNFETNDDGSISLRWRQTGKFQRYIISRYIITVKSAKDSKSYMSKLSELSKCNNIFKSNLMAKEIISNLVFIFKVSPYSMKKKQLP